MYQQNVSLTIQNTTSYEITFRNFYYLIITERIFKDITKYKNKKQEKNYFFIFQISPQSLILRIMFYSCRSDEIPSILSIRFHTCEFPTNDSLYLPIIAYHIKIILLDHQVLIGDTNRHNNNPNIAR